jgi:uncharacterized protein (TIGR02246 family)
MLSRQASILVLVQVFLAAATAVADEAAVKQMIGDYATAFNAKQIETVMSFWTENGVHVDLDTGVRTEGREAIQADMMTAFQQRPENRMLGRIDSLRFVKPDVASVDGRVVINSPNAEPVESAFSAILVEQGGKWMIDTIEEVAIAAPEVGGSPLADLGWLVGRWIDVSDEAATENLIRWSPNRNFLVRTYGVTDEAGVLKQGTQVIGWDPRAAEIRSWSFNPDGSFADGIWSKSGDQWLIKTTQTLADGTAATGTYVLTRISDDEMTLGLIGHTIEGEPQAPTDPVTATRVVEEEGNVNESEVKDSDVLNTGASATAESVRQP